MFYSEQSYPGLGDPRLRRQQRFSATDMLRIIFESFSSSVYEARIVSDRRTDTRTASWKTHKWLGMKIAYQRRFSFWITIKS